MDLTATAQVAHIHISSRNRPRLLENGEDKEQPIDG